MADVVTHLASGVLPAALFAPRLLGPVAIGTVLPDATGRVPQIAIQLLSIPVPDAVSWGLDVLHQPLAQLLFAGLIALGFCERDRRAALLGMVVGIGLHFGLDVLQDHHGQGYHLLFPLSVQRFELGWIGSEATVSVAPWIGAVTLVVVLWRLWRRATRPPDHSEGRAA